MRVVPDPNVLVSALLSNRGAPARLVAEWRLGNVELIVSPLLLAELEGVLQYPKLSRRVVTGDVQDFLIALRENAVSVADPTEPPSIRSADPADDYLLALAQHTRSALVSGDRHLQDLAERLPIFRPAQLMQLLRGDG